MPPKFNFAPRPAPYIVTADSPSLLELTSKTLLVFQDLDGNKTNAAGSSYTVNTAVAKLVIHDVNDLTITVRKGVVTTLEVHNATNLKLRLEGGTEETTSEASTACGTHTPAAYGTLTLDPHLENVSVDFQEMSSIGAVILTSPSQAAPSRTLSKVRLLVNGQSPYEISEQEEKKQRGQTGVQQHFFYSEGWQKKHLKREEKDYPSLLQ